MSRHSVRPPRPTSPTPTPASTVSPLVHTASRLIYYCFLGLFFLTPLILWTRTSEVFELNKMLFVYLTTAIISAIWLISSLRLGQISLPRTPLDLPILAFLISQILSTIISIDPHTSLWGYYSRFHGGLASTISYIILYYAFVQHLPKHPHRIANIFYSLIISSSLVSVYGVLEHFGIDKHIWIQDVQNRVFSTLGQPNWLSAFIAAILPLTLIQIFLPQFPTRAYRYTNIALSLLFTLTLLYTKSRSGIGAAFIAILLSFAYLFTVFRKAHRSLKPLFLAIGGVCLTLLLVGTPWTPTPTELSKSLRVGGPLLPNLERYLQPLYLTSQIRPYDTALLTPEEQRQVQLTSQGVRLGGSDSMDIRRIVWQGAIQLGLSHPFLGTGLETFGYTYYNVRPASHNLLSEWDFLYNKVHNEYLNFFANSGFLGLATYLLLILISLRLFTRHITAHPDQAPVHTALLIGYLTILITNYFGFSVVCIGLLFFLFPALSLALTHHHPNHLTLSLPRSLTIQFISAIVITIMIYRLFSFWQADMLYNQGKNLALISPDYLTQSTKLLTQATHTNPSEPIYLSTLAETEAQLAYYIHLSLQTPNSPVASLSAQTVQQLQSILDQLTQSSLAHASQAVSLNPYHVHLYKSQAKSNIYLALIDSKYYTQTITALQEVLRLSPTDAKAHYNLAIIYDAIHLPDLAVDHLRQAVLLKPDYQEARSQLSQLEIKATTSAQPANPTDKTR